MNYFHSCLKCPTVQQIPKKGKLRLSLPHPWDYLEVQLCTRLHAFSKVGRREWEVLKKLLCCLWKRREVVLDQTFALPPSLVSPPPHHCWSRCYTPTYPRCTAAENYLAFVAKSLVWVLIEIGGKFFVQSWAGEYKCEIVNGRMRIVTNSHRSVLQLSKQLEAFKGNLEDFAAKHKDEIRRNPQFRVQFQEMCASIGVDPLACEFLFAAHTVSHQWFGCSRPFGSTIYGHVPVSECTGAPPPLPTPFLTHPSPMHCPPHVLTPPPPTPTIRTRKIHVNGKLCCSRDARTIPMFAKTLFVNDERNLHRHQASSPRVVDISFNSCPALNVFAVSQDGLTESCSCRRLSSSLSYCCNYYCHGEHQMPPQVKSTGMQALIMWRKRHSCATPCTAVRPGRWHSALVCGKRSLAHEPLWTPPLSLDMNHKRTKSTLPPRDVSYVPPSTDVPPLACYPLPMWPNSGWVFYVLLAKVVVRVLVVVSRKAAHLLLSIMLHAFKNGN